MTNINKPYTFSANTTASSSQVNDNFDTIYNDYNGGISSTNLADGAVTAAKIGTSAVTTAKIIDGAVTPAKLASNPYRFRAYRNAAANAGTSGTPAKITFDTENFDYNNNFATGTYTAPLAGTYHFDARTKWVTGGSEQALIIMYKNGSAISSGTNLTTGGISHVSLNVSDTIELAANDTIDIYCANSAAGAKALETGSANTYFAGYLVSKT